MHRAPLVTRAMAAFSAILLVGSVLANPAVAAGGETASPIDDGTVAHASAAYLAAFPQMSKTAAEAAFLYQPARKELYRQVAHDAATFGGSWFDPPSGVMHVAVTAAGAAARAEQIAERLGVRLEVHLVERSYAALERQADALRTGTGSLSRAAAGKVGIDVAANQVVVAVPQSLRPPLGTAPAGVRVVAATASRTEMDAGCTSRLACDASVRSGAVLRLWGLLPICSAGFTARSAAGQRFLYTAGHCNIAPGRWSTGTQSIGPITDSRRNGAVDAAIIRVDNTSFADDHGGEIYSEDSESGDHFVALNDVAFTMSDLQQGDVVCLAANITDLNGPNLCGVLGSISDPAQSGMVRVDGVDACAGDSGGGWYGLISTTHRVAYGIHSDSESGCHGDSGGSRSWFSPIPEITAVWGLTIETR